MQNILLVLFLLTVAQVADAAERQMTLTGTISVGTAVSNLVTSDDKSYDFESESKAGDKIFKVCQVDDTCTIIGMVEDDQFIRSVSSVKKVPRAILIIPPAKTPKQVTDIDIKKRQPVEVTGVINQGHDAAGGNFWINGGKAKQYTLGYVWDLDESAQAVLNSLAASQTKVLVKGTLMTWKDGSASFDDGQPVNIFSK